MRKGFILICIAIFCTALLGVKSPGQEASHYIIQLGSFKDLQNAQSLQNLLTSKGFPAYRITGQYITIAVGPYSTEESAEAALQNLAAKGFNYGLIKKIYLGVTQAPQQAPLPPKLRSFPELKVKNTLIGEDIIIKRVHQVYAFYVYVDSYWIPKECYLELYFTQSQIKRYKNSTLTVKINSIPLYSFLLSEADWDGQGIKIPIPVANLKSEYNELQIAIYRRITDEPCTDEVNPANWLVIEKESFVHLSYLTKPDSDKISDFPYPFLNQGENSPVDCAIVVDNIANNPHLQTAMMMAAYFGQSQQFKNLNVVVAEFAAFPNKDKTNLIYIGDSTNLPPEIRLQLTPPELRFLATSALIKKTPSPYGAKEKLLLILSDNPAALANAVTALSLKELVAQMSTPVQQISPDLVLPLAPETESARISLADLGYDNFLATGLTQNISYDVRFPKNWMVQKDAYIELKFKYVKTLNFNQSYLTVYLNDYPIKSKTLSMENADEDTLRLSIPNFLQNETMYNLKIVSYLEVKDIDCRRFDPESLWLFLSNQSYFLLPHTDRDEQLLENYTGVFVKERHFNDLLVILPDAPTQDMLSLAGNIIAFLGHEVKSLKNLSVKTVHEFTAKDWGENIILLGTPRENRLVAGLNHNLAIQFAPRFAKFKSNKEFPLLDDYDNNLASIQLIDSPYNPKRKMMVVTATQHQGLQYALPYLTDLEFNARLKGTATIIDQAGNIKWAYYGVMPPKPFEEPGENLASARALNPNILKYLFFAGIALVATLLGIFFIITNGRKKKS